MGPVSVVPGGNEFRGIAVADMDGDSLFEIALGYAFGTGESMYLVNNQLQILPGWPKITQSSDGFSWGVYNDNPGLRSCCLVRFIKLVNF